MERIKCFIKGLRMFLRCGEFCGHVYTDSIEPAIIIATKNNFRVSDNLMHTKAETVYPHACLITSTCICCGKKDLSWHRSYIEWSKLNKT